MQTKEENAKEEVLQMPVMHKRQKPLQGLSAVRPRSLLNDTSTMLGGKFDTLLERRDEKSFLCCICFTRLCCWYLHRLGVCSHIYHCWPQWQCASLLPLRQHRDAACSSRAGLSRQSARRCRKSFCGFVFQAAINAQYFHTSKTLATCPPCHQGKGSRTYSCWPAHPVKKQFLNRQVEGWHICSVNLTIFSHRDLVIWLFIIRATETR